MVQRIAQRVGNGLGPLLELFPIGGILTRTVALVDTIGTHSTPLIVIATQP